MQLDQLKNTWQQVKTPEIPAGDIIKMLSENNHPVLKGIRRQIIIELIGWTAFLLCYYTMFDGDRKPFWINGLLIFSVLLPIIHNLMGYNFARYLVNGINLQQSLKTYLARVKIYAVISLASRALFAAGFLVFFIYSIKLDTSRYYMMAVVALIFAIQLTVLCRVWANRISTIKVSLRGFEL